MQQTGEASDGGIQQKLFLLQQAVSIYSSPQVTPDIRKDILLTEAELEQELRKLPGPVWA